VYNPIVGQVGTSNQPYITNLNNISMNTLSVSQTIHGSIDGNALTANTVTNGSQPYITSLDTVSVNSAAISNATITTGTATTLTVSSLSMSGGSTSQITGSVSGSAATVRDASQSFITDLPNVTSIGESSGAALSLCSAGHLTTVQGNLTCAGNFITHNMTVLGTVSTINSVTTENSNLIINNNSIAGPALSIFQTGTGGHIVDFYNTSLSSSVPVLGVTDAGFVGINTSSPTVALDVTGYGHISQDLTVDGNIFSTGLATSNLQVLSDAVFGCNMYIAGDTHINGTLYASKIRLGSVYTTTIVNGLLTATLSPAAQSNISHLSTVTVDNLTAPIANLGTLGNTTTVNGDMSVAGSLTANLSTATMNSIISSVSAAGIVGGSGGSSSNTSNITANGSATTVGGDLTVIGNLTANLSASTLSNIQTALGSTANTSNITTSGSNTTVSGNLIISGSNLVLGGFTFNITSGGAMNISDGNGNILTTISL
jgi:hypothetical protein